MNATSIFAITAIMTLFVCSENDLVQEEKTIQLSEDVVVEEIAPGHWLHTTYLKMEGYGLVGANGLIVIDGREAAMIDLPWTDEQTATLFEWVEKKRNAIIKTVIPTHSHLDCAGGLAEAHRRGATSIALDKTDQILRRTNKPRVKKVFTDTATVKVGNADIVLSFMGAGHTVDNIVAWIPGSKMLFAGCLLKGFECKGIGNTKEADLESYPETLRKIKAKYNDSRIVVPGHGRPGSLGVIDHTVKLLAKHMKKRTLPGNENHD